MYGATPPELVNVCEFPTASVTLAGEIVSTVELLLVAVCAGSAIRLIVQPPSEIVEIASIAASARTRVFSPRAIE